MRQKNERWIDTRWSEETRKTPYQSLFTSKSAEVLSAPVTRWVSIYGMRIYLVRSRKDVKEKSKKANKRGDDKPPVGRKREGWLGVRSSVISPGMMDGRALRDLGGSAGRSLSTDLETKPLRPNIFGPSSRSADGSAG